MSRAAFSLSSSASSCLTKARCASSGCLVDGRIDDLQAHRGVGPRRRIGGEVLEPRRALDPVEQDARIGVGAGEQRLQAADALCPLKRVEIVLHAQHRGRVDGLALEYLLHELAALGEAEDLRQRPGRRVALQPLDGARREDQHAVRGLPAQHLLPGEGGDIDLRPVDRLREDGRGGIGEGEPAALGRDPVAVGNAHARTWCRST